jgi:hypothetical protein
VVIRKWEAAGEPPKVEARTSITDWKEAFLQDAKPPSERNLLSETSRKYVLLFKQLEAFAIHKGFRHADQMDLAALTGFRATWKDAPLSASKKLERLRNILRFALRRKWVRENAAVELDAPALKLTRQGNKIRLYQAKTGEFVYVPIPRAVATALRSIPHKNPLYFFWSGHSKTQAAASLWRKRPALVSKSRRYRTGTRTGFGILSRWLCWRRASLWKPFPSS